jgi:hypothetical protein
VRRSRRSLRGHSGSDGRVLAVTGVRETAATAVAVMLNVVGGRCDMMGMVVVGGVGVVGWVFLRDVGANHDHRDKVNKVRVFEFDVHFKRVLGPVHLVTGSHRAFVTALNLYRLPPLPLYLFFS